MFGLPLEYTTPARLTRGVFDPPVKNSRGAPPRPTEERRGDF
jgi:hypothetical protein